MRRTVFVLTEDKDGFVTVLGVYLSKENARTIALKEANRYGNVSDYGDLIEADCGISYSIDESELIGSI